MLRTARITFQSSGFEPQTTTLRVCLLPGHRVDDAIHAALDAQFGAGDDRRLVSFEFVN